jgi:hypothetical protein
MFAPLDAPTLEYLAGRLSRREVDRGGDGLQEGGQGRRVLRGRLGEVEVTADGGPPRCLRKGDFFGEIALLRDVPRTATVVAKTDAELYELGREDFVAAVTGTWRHSESRTPWCSRDSPRSRRLPRVWPRPRGCTASPRPPERTRAPAEARRRRRPGGVRTPRPRGPRSARRPLPLQPSPRPRRPPPPRARASARPSLIAASVSSKVPSCCQVPDRREAPAPMEITGRRARGSPERVRSSLAPRRVARRTRGRTHASTARG